MVIKVIEYFRSLADNSKHIKSFVMLDYNEMVDKIGSGSIKYPCLAMEVMTGEFSGARSDNMLTSVNGGFLILKRASEHNYQVEMDILSETFDIGCKIIARMNEDRRKRTGVFAEIDLDVISWEQIGPVDDNSFGTLFKIKSSVAIDLECNPDDWNG